MLKATFPLWQVFFRSVHFPNKPALSFRLLVLKEVGWGWNKRRKRGRKEGRQPEFEKRGGKKKETWEGSEDKGQDCPIVNL